MILACAAVVLLAVVAVWFVRQRADAAWQTMQATIATIEAELRAQPTQRAPLWGEPGPGNAFEHYQRAAVRLPDRDEWRDELADTCEASAPPSASLREPWPAALAALRAGAAATDVARPLPGHGRADPTEVLWQWRMVAQCAGLEARALRAAGDHVGAARCWLDAASLAGDLTQGATLIEHLVAAALIGWLCTELSEAELERMPADALELLAAGCARLDARLPVAPDPRPDLLTMAALVQAADTPGGIAADWRHGFSLRWSIGAAVTALAEQAQEVAVDADAAWPIRAARLTAASETLLANTNPIVRMIAPNLPAVEREWRRLRATVRVLRVSLDLHRGLDVPELEDPVGGGFVMVTPRDGGLHVACAPLGEGDEPTRRVVR
mgnify:CR=1 FL=1